MAYMNQDKKANIVAALKPICKKYGIKASFAVDNHSTFVVNISKSKLDFIQNYIQTTGTIHNNLTNIQLNPFWYQNHFSGICKLALHDIITTINKIGKNYNNSDLMTDYHDVGFYVDVNIGKWNKPFQTI